MNLTDASGGVLPGVSVVFTNQANQRVHTVQTDGSGAYRIELPPGIYSVRFELSGFARQETPKLEVQLGRIYDLDASLKVGNVSEAVQVTAENAPLVDTRSTIIAHNVTAEEIDRLPKGRSFQSIALTAPSVNSGEIEGGFQVNGASGAENAFTVDGVNTTSLVNGSSRQNTVFEYIQEVQVKTTGIPAEFGGALGGVISAVTKSGGNIFTGEGHYYLDGSPLSAGPVKRLVLSPIDDTTVTYVQDEKQHDIRQEFGGSVGGPIVRDKVFFFGSFSPRINTRTNEYMFSSGTDPGDIERTTKLIQAFGKVSVGSRRVNAYVTALATPTYVKGTLLAYNGIGPQFVVEHEGCSGAEHRARLGADAGQHDRQRRRRHLERRVRDVPRRLLPRSLHRHRHSDRRPAGRIRRRAGGAGNGATLPASIQGPVEPRQYAARADHATSIRRNARRSTPTTTTRSRVAAGTR